MEWGNYGIFHTWQGPKIGGSLVPLPVCIMFRKIVTYDPKGSCGQERETYPKEKPPISHLFFADDLILFAKASKSQIYVIMESLFVPSQDR